MLKKSFWQAPKGYSTRDGMAWAAGYNDAVAAAQNNDDLIDELNERVANRDAIIRQRGAEIESLKGRRVVGMHPALGAGFAPLSMTERITQYLGNGGFFNPELMDHQAVRDLLIAARAAIGVLTERARKAPQGNQWRSITEHPTESGSYWIWQPGTNRDGDWVGHWAYRADLGKWGNYSDYSPKRGSFWMPLPKPPVAQ